MNKIVSFDEKILAKLEVLEFNSDIDTLSWSFTFNNNAFDLYFAYSVDKTVSIIIYHDGRSVVDVFFNGLINLDVEGDCIICTINTPNLKRLIELDTKNISMNIKEFISL